MSENIQLEFSLSIPPRTKLFCLAPNGSGTGEVESFPSWVTRLARAHRIGVRTLLLQVLPKSEKKIARSGRRRVRTNIFSQPDRILRYLAKATGRKVLSTLYFDRWYQYLSRLNVIRKHRAWCPECLKEAAYERLSWTMRLVSACPRHGTRLLECCPACQKTISPLRLGTCVDYCPHCGGWLGISPKQTEPVNEWEMHTAKEISSILALKKLSPTPNAPFGIAEGLRGLLPTWTQEEICRFLGLNNNFFALLRKRNKTVSLDLLCKISFALTIPILDILFQSPSHWEAKQIRSGHWQRPTRQLIHTQHDHIKDLITHKFATEKVRSLRALSLQLGHSRQALHRNFPGETQKFICRSERKTFGRVIRLRQKCPGRF